MTTIQVNVEKDLTSEELKRYQEVIIALTASGGMDLRNGKVMLHFDSSGTFQGVQLDYWAFRRAKQ